MIYHPLFEALHREKVVYLLCGGLAINLYGIPRMTADIDILLDFTAENVEALQRVLSTTDYQPLLPLPFSNLIDATQRAYWYKERNLIAYSYFSNAVRGMSLDILLDTASPFAELWQRKEVRMLNAETPVYLVNPHDLIAMKTLSGRPQDREDILNLQKII